MMMMMINLPEIQRSIQLPSVAHFCEICFSFSVLLRVEILDPEFRRLIYRKIEPLLSFVYDLLAYRCLTNPALE